MVPQDLEAIPIIPSHDEGRVVSTDRKMCKQDGSASSQRQRQRQSQPSIQSFFGTSARVKRPVSLPDDRSGMNAAIARSPMTPPTPASPDTPQTPPSPSIATANTPPTGAATDDDTVHRHFKIAKFEMPNRIPHARSLRSHDGSEKKYQQMYLDLGQKDFGRRTICSICGMMYVHGVSEDSQQHARICQNFTTGVPFNMPKARVVATDRNGSVVEVRPSDCYALRSKLKRAMEIVDHELGFLPSSVTAERTAYLYIAGMRIVGLVTAEIIASAFPLTSSSERSIGKRKAMLGVHKIWVHSKFRNRGVATRLVDAVRSRMVFGIVVPSNLLAFSSPTEAGTKFARRYVASRSNQTVKDILVYDCH